LTRKRQQLLTEDRGLVDGTALENRGALFEGLVVLLGQASGYSGAQCSTWSIFRWA
jgi:hypothetical protein